MSGETYRSAGVDIGAADIIKEMIHRYARTTHTTQVMGEQGFFSGLFHLQGYRDPVIVASMDNVGTKLKVAVLMDHYDSAGVDVVNQNVNDVITTGARPLFFLDYIAMDRLDSKAVEGLMRGIALACRQAGCALIGGETAELPGVYQAGAFELTGFVVGVMERDAAIDASSIREGDLLLGLPSSGLHTNGFSLVRRVFRIEDDPSVLHRYYPELGRALGDELLIPHRSYVHHLESVRSRVKGVAHITGGGIPGNVPRVLPEGLAARIRRGSWREPPIFKALQETGGIDTEEMFNVFNMGLGMVLAVSAEDAPAVQEAVPEAAVVGEVVRGEGDRRVVIEGL